MKILIEGDSWAYVITNSGQGTVLNEDQTIKHRVNQAHVIEPFLEHFLNRLDHDTTTNAEPGSSNLDIVQRLKDNSETDYDLIIIFQTTPCRNYNVQKPQDMSEKDFSDLKSLSKMSPTEFDAHIQLLLEQFYTNLHNVITNRYNCTPTLLIGGCSSIEQTTFNKFLKKVNNQSPLVILFNSALEYLGNVKLHHDLAPYKFKQHSEITLTSMLKFVDDEWNKELVDYIYEVDKHYVDFSPARIFTWPDGRHLNRDAFFYLADEILFWAEQNIDSFAEILETTYP